MSEEQTKIAIVASKGTLDMAYPPLILATAASALDMEAQIFFTFYGLNIIHKERMEGLDRIILIQFRHPNIFGTNFEPVSTKVHGLFLVPYLLIDEVIRIPFGPIALIGEWLAPAFAVLGAFVFIISAGMQGGRCKVFRLQRRHIIQRTTVYRDA